MGHTVAEFHKAAADMLTAAKGAHDTARTPDNVTVWRQTAHVMNMYANKEKMGSGPAGWGVFWSDGMDHLGFMRLLARRTRFARCGADGDAPLYDDSVTEWEFSLAHLIVGAESAHAYAERINHAEAVRRIGLELETAVRIAAAYTGREETDVMAALRECDGEVPRYSHGPNGREYSPHPLFELLTAARPAL